jgi:hypothetical protein
MKKTKSKLVINLQLMSLKSKNITRNKRADKEISAEDKIQEIKIEVKEAEED